MSKGKRPPKKTSRPKKRKQFVLDLVDLGVAGVQGGITGAAVKVVETIGSRLFKTDSTRAPGFKQPVMRRRRGSRRQRGRRPPRRARGQRITVRHVVPYSAISGSQHRWYYNITLKYLISAFSAVYHEFKVLSLRVRYVPNNASNETGLVAGVLLDRDGFGGYRSATAKSWFKTIGAMPGAQIHPRYQAITMNWRPTESTARDWYKKDANITYATAYVCNNGQETEELGGIFELHARFAVRGLYYDAKVENMLTVGPDGLKRPIDDDRSPPSIASETMSGDFETLCC